MTARIVVRPERVPVTEIERQRALGWPDMHPEDYCHRCGAANPVWVADNETWNAVMAGYDWPHLRGKPEPSHPVGVVCPTCFALLAKRAGVDPIWHLTPWQDGEHNGMSTDPTSAEDATSMTDTTGLVTESAETLAEALAKWLCREKHGSAHGGYCANCLSRAEQIGVPALLASGAVRPAAEVRAEALRDARVVIAPYLSTAEKWRYDRVGWAFAVMLGEIPEDTPEPLSPADEREIALRAALAEEGRDRG